MGSLDVGPRHRDHLPAIGFLGKDAKHPVIAGSVSSPAPLISPPIMYSSQPPSYPYTTPTASNGSLPSGYISPPESRRALEEEKERQIQPQRQSLPSIHEALGNDNPLSYGGPPTSAPAQQVHPSQAPPHSASPGFTRSGTEAPTGPPNPFSFSHQHHQQLQAEASRSSLASINTQDSRTASLHSFNSGRSPTQSAKTGITTNSTYEYSAPPSAGGIASPTGYAPPYSQSFSFQSQPTAPAYPSHYDARYGAWKQGAPEPVRVEEIKNGYTRSPLPVHSDSMKRHLEVYDVEASLNEITEMSTRTLDFSRHYATRAHQTQRSGPVMGSLPSLNEVEEMINAQRQNQEALLRIRNAVLTQEHAMAEQMAQRKAYKASGVDEEMAMYQEEFKGSGGFAGAEAKKRRGKAAPPGRCHSCNRAETPEWRRGPDGARTLCNACGLHYAKLTRKMGANKASALGSNLKPKTPLGSASPN